MIDIIIPAYNAHETITQTLLSIACQKNIEDCKVYIVNDKSEKNYSQEIKIFSRFMDIKELKLKKNSGPGIARQYGIDNSSNPYIVFIDSDDVFASPIALQTLYSTIKEYRADVVISNFIEETKYEMIEHNGDTVWLHGKIYKRKFLEKNHIKFNNTRANEDNGFNQSILLRSPKVEYIDDITYYWCYNEQSITRINNHEYNFSGLEGYIENITLALEGAIQDNCKYKEISSLAWSVLATLYCYYVEFISNENVDILLKKSKRLKQICFEYPIKNSAKKEETIANAIKDANNVNQILINPPLTLEEFISKI